MSGWEGAGGERGPQSCACVAEIEAALNAVFGSHAARPRPVREALAAAAAGPVEPEPETSALCPFCASRADGDVAESTAARMAAEPPAARHAHGRLNLDRIRSLLRPK